MPLLNSTMDREELLPEDCIKNISVDNLIFSVHEGELKVLLVKYTEGLGADQWGLVGHWIKKDESLEQAASRVVKEITGSDNLYLDQLGAFGDVERYPLRRIITIAYYSLVRHDETLATLGNQTTQVNWFNIHQLPELVFDHKDIITAGIEHLRYKVRHEPVGFSLLPEKFTLLELQEIYESILNKKLDKPNFRRKILKMNLLIDCQEKQKNVAHRAARLYRFDIHVYQKLKEFGFTFEY